MSGNWKCCSSRGLSVVVCAVSAALLLTAGLAGADEPAEGGAVAGQAEQGKHPANRLARESSPYLLMHAHNPIQWYPWGPEAFEKARSEDKPVFLSVGYSSCYWCHVMEREVFSNEKIAAYMNEKYVCIKVDREERPDVDDIYMTSLIVYQQAAGSRAGGGWPLSMFLDGEGNPIAGATYLPPEDTPDGRTGFLTAAERIHELWTGKREAVSQTSTMIAREVRRLSGPGVLAEPVELNAGLLQTIAQGIQGQYDPQWGGVDFNPRRPDGPRFPNVPRLRFLLSLYRQTGEQKLWDIVSNSLTSMAKGGIRDHLGGGFHRYSTERTWTVPHFEKMLYDQAQFLEVYAEALQVEANPLYQQVVDELVGFLTREMILPDGGFCSALDAETNAIEGQFYVWTEAEIREVLGAGADEFLRVYGFAEPQDFEHGRILYLPREQAGIGEGLSQSRQQLLQRRDARPRPFLDDKVLTEWNALLIQALATSGRLPGRASDLQLAERAADFLLQQLQDEQGQLVRSWRQGVRGPRAYLDDYACLAAALRALHQATGQQRWQDEAKRLTAKQMELFYDAGQKTFFFTSNDHEKLFARTSSVYDSVSPSGNSVALLNLLALREQEPDYGVAAEEMLRRYSGTMTQSPASCAGLGLALQQHLGAGGVRTGRAGLGGGAGADWLRSAGTVVPVSLGLWQSASDEKSGAQAAGKSDEKKKETRPIKAKIYPFYNKLPRGGKCPVAIELTVAEGWHVNANPASEDYLIPTEVKVSSAQKVRLTRVKYPEGHKLSAEAGETAQVVYDGKVMIYGMLETDAGELSEQAEVTVEIHYQACRDKVCERPDKLRLVGKLQIADADSGIQKINEAQFPK